MQRIEKADPNERNESAPAQKSYAVTVEFKLKRESMGYFLELVRENAATSVREEPDCRRFDVLVPRDSAQSDTVTLYEHYADRAAFYFHLATRHFEEFDRATKDMVVTKTVDEFDVDENTKRGIG